MHDTDTTTPLSDDTRVRVGISACLLGHEVRYDGAHKYEPALADDMARLVAFLPVCPEVELGLGVPRESIELNRAPADMGDAAPDGAHGASRPLLRLLGVHTRIDHTDAMRAYAERKLAELQAQGIRGYIFKKKSPSCGVSGVPIFDPRGQVEARGSGMFADALMERFPHLPVVEEDAVRERDDGAAFLARVFAYDRLQALDRAEVGAIGELVAFHSREKLLLMAYHEVTYRELGRLVAHASQRSWDALLASYRAGFMAALAHRPSRGQHANALQHAAGYFFRRGDREGREGRARLGQYIRDYQAGRIALDVPLEQLRRLAAEHGIDYLSEQSYLSYPVYPAYPGHSLTAS